MKLHFVSIEILSNLLITKSIDNNQKLYLFFKNSTNTCTLVWLHYFLTRWYCNYNYKTKATK